MARDAILFGGTDPGRFCPTYIIFCESFIPHYCQPKQDQKFDRRDVYIITQNALADGTYLDYLRAQYNRSKQVDPPFFSRLIPLCHAAVGAASAKAAWRPMAATWAAEIPAAPSWKASATCLTYTLDVPFTTWGAYVEKYRRAAGVYPPKEIYIPSPEDSQNCFQSYEEDVARRQQLGQLKPGEDVNVENGRVQVSGQVAVMEINGLLCKVIFDNNPTNEFYVEESFPLDWMYDYETPFGVIMKINRHPVTELSDDVFRRDHDSGAIIPNGFAATGSITIPASRKSPILSTALTSRTITRASPATARLCATKTRRRRFPNCAVRRPACMPGAALRPARRNTARNPPPARRPCAAKRTSPSSSPLRFALTARRRFSATSISCCSIGRFDDALIVAETCQKLDPFNDQISGTVEQLKSYEKQNAERTQGHRRS